MPWYKFAFDGGSVPRVQDPEWHPHDVATLVSAAEITAELIRNYDDITLLPSVMAFRVES
jgi:hypothetical protein